MRTVMTVDRRLPTGAGASAFDPGSAETAGTAVRMFRRRGAGRSCGGWHRWRIGLAALAVGALVPPRLDAVTLIELVTNANLTPKKFAAYFEDFDYEFSPEVLPAETFLRQERGDCDDYAILADYVLSGHQQQTRLIHVRMVGRVAHAICYVSGAKAYLDYNNRKFFFNVQRCGATLREIATEVADSLKANWTSVSEFTYDYGEDKKHFSVTVVKTDPLANDPDVNPSPSVRPRP